MGFVKKMQLELKRLAGETLAKSVGRSVAKRYGRDAGPLPDAPGTISVSGLLARRTGISRGAEQQVLALRRCGFDVRLRDANAGIRNPFRRAAEPVAGGALIVHSGGPQLAQIVNFHAPSARVRRIGYIAWELPAPPHHWQGFDAGADEIWTPSHFSADALRQVTCRPVHVVRHVSAPPVTVEKGKFRTRFGADDGVFLALAFADLRSSLARKNPLGAITAFRLAFGDRRDVRLVVKLTAADRAPELVAQLQEAAGEANVEFFCEHLTDGELWSLFADADVFLSLHRAEGFGLPMLEAMAVGCPVVATGWSGNCDFMSADTAALVPYRLVDVTDPQGIYRSGVWAEPDLDVAVDRLRQLQSDTVLRHKLAAAGLSASTRQQQLARFESDLPDYFKAMRYTAGQRVNA